MIYHASDFHQSLRTCSQNGRKILSPIPSSGAKKSLMRFPKKRAVLVALAAILLAIGLAAIVFQSPPEPSYQGEPLNSWLDDMAQQQRFTKRKHNFEECRTALQTMGPSAIPFIIHKLNQNDSPWHNKYRERWPNLPPFLKSHLPKPNDGMFDARIAAMAIGHIGTNALPYLPSKMHDSNPAVREAALTCLSGLYFSNHATNKTIALSIPALKDSDAAVRLWAAMALGRIGPAASNAVPALIGDLQSGEAGRHSSKNERVYVRANTALALGNIGPAAAAAVPALTNLMATGDSYARVCAAGAIWQITSNENLSLPVLIAEMPGFTPHGKHMPAGMLMSMGPRAKPAFPMLADQFSRYQELGVHEAISNALVAIDPDAAAKLFAEKSTPTLK